MARLGCLGTSRLRCNGACTVLRSTLYGNVQWDHLFKIRSCAGLSKCRSGILLCDVCGSPMQSLSRKTSLLHIDGMAFAGLNDMTYKGEDKTLRRGPRPCRLMYGRQITPSVRLWLRLAAR